MNRLQFTKFQNWFKALNREEKIAFAKRAGTTIGMIQAHYLRREGKIHPEHRNNFQSTSAQPKSRTMMKLAKASKGALTYEDMLTHFYRL